MITGDRKILFEIFHACSAITRTSGRDYVICWLHRISGCLLLLYLLLHVDTLSALANPEAYARKAELFSGSFMVFLEWLLALPVIFHCLNGGRVLFYELFDTGQDDRMMRSVFWMCGGYMILLAYYMIRGDQQVSPHFFWLNTVIASVFLCGLTVRALRGSRAGWTWKLQRITGSFLLLMVPAHMLFMHLNPQSGKDALFIIERINQPLVSAVDITLLLFILYHGGYGIISICNDYLSSRQVRTSCALGVIVILSMFGLQGIRLILTV